MIDESKYYSYIFLRKGLPAEQAAIQTAHAASKLTAEGFPSKNWPKGVTPDNLSYVMTPMYASPPSVACDLDEFDIPYIKWEDFIYSFSDSGELIESANKEVTAIMTFPIHESKRGILRGLPLYRIK